MASAVTSQSTTQLMHSVWACGRDASAMHDGIDACHDVPTQTRYYHMTMG
jgi:hypothetical protein